MVPGARCPIKAPGQPGIPRADKAPSNYYLNSENMSLATLIIMAAVVVGVFKFATKVCSLFRLLASVVAAIGKCESLRLREPPSYSIYAFSRLKYHPREKDHITVVLARGEARFLLAVLLSSLGFCLIFTRTPSNEVLSANRMPSAGEARGSRPRLMMDASFCRLYFSRSRLQAITMSLYGSCTECGLDVSQFSQDD